jgi:hypothetical protein
VQKQERTTDRQGKLEAIDQIRTEARQGREVRLKIRQEATEKTEDEDHVDHLAENAADLRVSASGAGWSTMLANV